MTMQQAFLAQQQQAPTLHINLRNPSSDRDDIPIQYNAGGGGPPPAPGGGREMVRSYGPARIPRERYTPFQGGGPPPAPGGATSPMPVPRPPPPPPPPPPPVIARFPGRGQRMPDDPRFVPFSGRSQRLPEPAPAPPAPPPPPQRKPKRKAPQQAVPVSLKPYRQPRGPGHQLPDEPPSFVPSVGGRNDYQMRII